MGQLSKTNETTRKKFLSFRQKLTSAKVHTELGHHKSSIDYEVMAVKNLRQPGISDPVLYIQEQERKRIAEALHNDLGQLLYCIRLNLSKIDHSELTEEVKGIKEKVEQLVHEAIATTRKISFELTPSLLKDFGLKVAIEELSKRSSCKLIQIKTFIDIDRRFDELTETSIFRIIQELVNNIIKHSEATEAKILVSESSNTVHIRVEDNGKGFLSEKKKGCGLGLHYIQDRVDQLHGELTIFSAPDKGTVAQIKFLMP
jgi:two-component system CheB/CheR fusion protein